MHPPWSTPVPQYSNRKSVIFLLTKKSVCCVKLFSLKNFTLSLAEAPKAHYFCFLLLIQRFAVQQKANKATLPNTQCFFYCKNRVVRTIAMFIAS